MNRYTPRTEAPATDNPYYYSNINIFHKYGFGMPNCTCYAWGRFYEITGESPRLSTADAERWWSYAGDGYGRGSTPKLGAVACWAKGSPTSDSDGSGHVAIVEDVKDDGTIETSNSAHSGDVYYNKTIRPPYTLSGYTFQGFIYSPIEFTNDFPLWLLFKFNDRRLKRC